MAGEMGQMQIPYAIFVLFMFLVCIWHMHLHTLLTQSSRTGRKKLRSSTEFIVQWVKAHNLWAPFVFVSCFQLFWVSEMISENRNENMHECAHTHIRTHSCTYKSNNGTSGMFCCSFFSLNSYYGENMSGVPQIKFFNTNKELTLLFVNNCMLC